MGLLVTLNEEGYQTLKNDREVIEKKIKELQMVLNYLDAAYKTLQPFYEPEIRISIRKSIREDIYTGTVIILPFHQVGPRRISFRINSVNKYKGINDKRLRDEAKQIARNKLIEIFPTYFEIK